MSWKKDYSIIAVRKILLDTEKYYFTREDLTLQYKDNRTAKVNFVYENCYYTTYGDLPETIKNGLGKYNKNKEFFFIKEESDLFNIRKAIIRDKKIDEILK